MGKKFSELKNGDTIWLWNYTSLHELKLTSVVNQRELKWNGEKLAQATDGAVLRIGLFIEDDYNGHNFILIYPESFDKDVIEYFDEPRPGWQMKKIVGTSKQAVKWLLEKILKQEKKHLEELKKEWLSKFD